MHSNSAVQIQAQRLATLGVFKMATINAKTIINAVNAAAALAPAYHDGAAIDAMPSGQPHDYDGAAEYAEIAEANGKFPFHYCHAASEARKQAARTVDAMQDAARAELRALFNVPLKIKVQTSERGYMRIVNTRERLQAFAATVRSNAKAFGGGLVRTSKAKPAQSWSTGAVRMVRELIEDHDYSGAAELAESKCGALFYVDDKGNHAPAPAFMMFAPMAVQGLPDTLASGRHENGKYSVYGVASGQCVKGQQTTRKAAEQQAIKAIQEHGLEKLERAIQKAGNTDHAAARAQWFTEHGIQDAAELTARIEASEAAADTTTQGPDLAELQAMAVRDVAQLVATATAAAAIEQAQDAAALQDAATTQPSEAAQDAQPVRELETVCEASSAANSQAMQQGQASTSAAPGAHGAARTSQTVQGKSGHWNAFMYRNAAGMPSLEFTGPDGARIECSYESGRERMQALQAMAKQADTLAECKAIAQDVDPLTVSTEAVQGWSPEQLGAVLDYLEDINYHSEALLIRALRTGIGAAIGYARRLVRVQTAAGYLSPEAAAMARELRALLDTPPTAPDYTNSRKTLEGESAQLHDTPQDLGNNPATVATPGALSIAITRAEGVHDECGKPVTLATFGAIDATLRAWSETVRKGGSSDKVDFSITWPNGDTYDGTYSLRHHSHEAPSLARHLIDFAEFETGLFCPAHMGQKAYANYLQTVSTDRHAFFTGVLETLRGLGAYFPKVRPTALDLRTLVQAGATMSQLVGLGVDYTPKQHGSTSGKGAIIEAYPDTWTGVRVEIQLEDGRELHADAADFADDGNYRLNIKNHGAPYLAQLAAAVATVRASASAAKEQAAQAHAAELQRLAAEFPQLKRSEGRHGGGKHAAINARILLKQHFKGIKFSVTSEYSSLRVHWTDGPTDAQVSEIIGRFDIGAADYQSDYFYTVDTAFSELFGGAQYVTIGREESDSLVLHALAEHFTDEATRPSLEDHRRACGLLDWNSPTRRAFSEYLHAIDARKA